MSQTRAIAAVAGALGSNQPAEPPSAIDTPTTATCTTNAIAIEHDDERRDEQAGIAAGAILGAEEVHVGRASDRGIGQAKDTSTGFR